MRLRVVWLPAVACVASALVTMAALAAPQEPGGRTEAEYSPLGYYDLRAYDKALADAQTSQKLGGQVRPEFLDALNRAMGGQPAPAAPESPLLAKKSEAAPVSDLAVVKPAGPLPANLMNAEQYKATVE